MLGSLSVVPVHLGDIGERRVPDPAGTRKRGRLHCIADICTEEVCRAGGEDAGRDIAVAQGMEEACDGAIAARKHAHVVVLRIADELFRRLVVCNLMERAGVSLMHERALELEDCVGAEARLGIVDYESSHISSRGGPDGQPGRYDG